MTGKCAKQEVIAIIENNGRYWVGTNWCWEAQEECPRKGMKTGEGYDKCEDICYQNSHAEINACSQAGEDARGGTIYILGHNYVCERCLEHINRLGITGIVIGQLPKSFMEEIQK